jgi:hypothetical protein
MVHPADEPIGARRDRIMRKTSESPDQSPYVILPFVCSQELSNKVSKLRQSNMLNLTMISDLGSHCTRDKVDELSPSGSVVSRTNTS